MPPGLPAYSGRMLADMKQMTETLNRETSKVLVRKARGGGGGSGGSESDLHTATTLAGLPTLTDDDVGHRGFVTTVYMGPYVWDGAQWIPVPVFYPQGHDLPSGRRNGDFYEDDGILTVQVNDTVYHLTHTRTIT